MKDRSRAPRTGQHQELNRSRQTFAVDSSTGNVHSMRNSSNVTSCGVPNVVIVEKKRSSTSPFRKKVVSSGVGGIETSRVRQCVGVPGYASTSDSSALARSSAGDVAI